MGTTPTVTKLQNQSGTAGVRNRTGSRLQSSWLEERPDETQSVDDDVGSTKTTDLVLVKEVSQRGSDTATTVL